MVQIRTPNVQKPQQYQQQLQQPQQQQHQNQNYKQNSEYLTNSQQSLIQQPPPVPIYHPSNSALKYNHPKPYDIPTAVNSIVENWEADLAKNVKRRPSGQFDSCEFL